MQSIDAIRVSLAPVFRAHDVNRVVLFGSVAKGTATDNSDLDLLVDSNLRGLRFVGLIEDIRAAAVCRWTCSHHPTSSEVRP